MSKPPDLANVPVHPANTAPKMTPAQLKELAADIKKRGMDQPIVYWRDNREEANGAKGPFPIYLLDGDNRWHAAQIAGYKDPNSIPVSGTLLQQSTIIRNAIKRVVNFGSKSSGPAWVTDVDPYAYHLSANVYRRHLSVEQKREAIKQAIKADPLASNLKIAKKVGVSDSTVRLTRAGMNGGGQNSRVADLDPLARAKAALADNPKLSLQQLMKQASVSKGTAVRARGKKKMDTPVDSKPSKPEPKPKKEKKPTETTQTTDEFVTWIIDFAGKSKVPLPTVITWLQHFDPKAAAKQLSRHLKGGTNV